MPRDDGWSVGAVRERCQNLRASLQQRASVTPAELEEFWPGGAQNPLKQGRGPWLYCYASLARLMGRAEAAGASNASEDDLLSALAESPVPIILSDGTEYLCYPKSFQALRWMAHADAILGAMLDRMSRIPLFASEDEEDLREEALQCSTDLTLALAWAALHPGIGLPFSDRQRVPELPDHIRALTPLDLYGVIQVYRRANLRGLGALPSLTDGEPNGKRPTFAMWISSMATESGVSSDVLMRERSLVQLMGQARLAAAARQPAKAGV